MSSANSDTKPSKQNSKSDHSRSKSGSSDREFLPLWLKLAWLETRSHPAFTFGFILNVCLGLIGFLTLDAFKVSIESQLSSKSQSAIGADISVWASRIITEEEYAKIASALPQGAKIRRETSLLSMATTASKDSPPLQETASPAQDPNQSPAKATRLVEIRAIDQQYPYYGALELKKQGLITSLTPKDVVQNPHVWIGPELSLQMGLKIGDKLKLGVSTFTVTDIVVDDPTSMPSGLAFAPRVFIGLDFLEKTGLSGVGSRQWQAVMIAVNAADFASRTSVSQTDLSNTVEKIRKELASPDLRVRSHVAAANDRNRALVYLNDYLGLVALVSLFLAAVGGSFLFQSFLARRATAIATLSALGLKRFECRLIYASQLVILGTLATGVTVILSMLVLPMLPWLLKGLLPEGMEPSLRLSSLTLALILATVGNLIVCLPILVRLGLIQASRLFQEGQGGGLAYRPGVRDLWTWLPSAATFWVLAIVQAHSIKVGSLFIAIFAVSLVIFAAVGLGLIQLLEWIRRRLNSLPLDLALLALVRHRTATLASFVAIALGSLLVNIIPALKNLVESEVESPSGKAVPSLFLIDIQEEQKDRLMKLVPEITGGVKLEKLSPFVRARLFAIDGDPSKVQVKSDENRYTTREDEESERFVNRGYNLSYRDSLFASETLVDGKFFSKEPFVASSQDAKKPEMSLEERFAERLGIKVGSSLTFDIEGVQIEGVVTSLRKVRWSSFDPNFFVIFQPGVLEEAPKTYIAIIPSLSTELKAKTEMKIVEEFPNISMIDISATAQRVLELADQMSQALALMAFLTLVSGLAVLFAIAHHQAQKRIIEITLLKVMGTDFKTIRLSSLVEFGILGLAASAIGAFISTFATALIAHFVFETKGGFYPMTVLTLTLMLSTTCTVTGFIALRKILKSKPALLLGEALFDKS